MSARLRLSLPGFLMAVNYMRIVLRMGFASLLVLLFVAFGVICLPKYRQLRQLSLKRDLLENRIQVKQQEIADLKRRQQRFREDPEFVERIARQNRRVRPGEIIFVGELPAPK